MAEKSRILFCGALMTDVSAMVGVPGSEELDALIEKYSLQWNGKHTEWRSEVLEEFKKGLLAYSSAHPIEYKPGGSVYNSACMLGKNADSTLLGMLGNDAESVEIRRISEQNDVHICPERFVSEPPAQPGISFELIPPSGERTYNTFPGNARKVFTPGALPELNSMVNNSDLICAIRIGVGEGKSRTGK